MATEGKDGNGKKQKEAKTQKQRTSLRNPGVDAEPIWEVNAASISHGRKQSYYGKSMLLAYPTANSNSQLQISSRRMFEPMATFCFKESPSFFLEMGPVPKGRSWEVLHSSPGWSVGPGLGGSPEHSDEKMAKAMTATPTPQRRHTWKTSLTMT